MMPADIFDDVIGYDYGEEEPTPEHLIHLNPIPIPDYLLYPQPNVLRAAQILAKAETSHLLVNPVVKILTWFADKLVANFFALLITGQQLKNRKAIIIQINARIELLKKIYLNSIEGS